jgi:rhamnogalacturonan endolyase
MLDGGHFGAGSIDVKENEEWTKFFGPFLVYVNSGPSDTAMFDDAKRQTRAEEDSWPYSWVDSSYYPLDRGTVTGKLRLTDGESAGGAWVVLADPGGDWSQQAKNYEFWTQARSDGSFSIPKVRSGSYALYAYGANQFEQLEKDGVVVSASKPTDLGAVDWKPVKHGQTLWQIGTPDRSTFKYRGGQDNWGPDGMRHWANFMSYPVNFPNDVTFTIGKSHEATDWNYAQWTWYCKKPYWSIDFSLQKPQTGTATLTLGFTASDPLQDDVRDALATKPIVGFSAGPQPVEGVTHLVVKVNGQQAAVLLLPKSGAAAYRSSGEDSLYQLKYVTFPAALLKAGANEVTLGDSEATPFPSKDEQMLAHVGAVMYDSIRLEVGN